MNTPSPGGALARTAHGAGSESCGLPGDGSADGRGGPAGFRSETVLTHSFSESESIVIDDFVLAEHTEPTADTGAPSPVAATDYRTTGRLVWRDGTWLVTTVDIDS